MKIFSINLKGVETKLKYPIVVEEVESWMGGKRMYTVSIEEFGFFAMHNDLEIAKNSIIEGLNIMIDSYLFEPGYIVSEKAMVVREKMKRYIYG